MSSISRNNSVSRRRCCDRTDSLSLRWCKFCLRWSAAPSTVLARRPSLYMRCVPYVAVRVGDVTCAMSLVRVFIISLPCCVQSWFPAGTVKPVKVFRITSSFSLAWWYRHTAHCSIPQKFNETWLPGTCHTLHLLALKRWDDV